MTSPAWSSLGIAITVFVTAGCEVEPAPARDQWIVTLSTDAPVPALGDRVLVEIYGPDGVACDGCTRLFGAESFDRWPMSFGVPAEPAPTMIRARLFRGELAGAGGEPASAALIDVLTTLPRRPDGIEEVGLALPAACFGVPADPSTRSSCDPATGALAPAVAAEAFEPLATGSWLPARAAPCPGAPPAGMACVPGGVFLLGAPDPPRAVDPSASPLPERLVQLPPYFMDVHELTNGELAALMSQHPTLTPPYRTMPGAYADCTFDPETPRPAAPVNCISRGQAVTYCEAQGKRLPTEAEWEYAASNGSRETPYPWGDDEPDCDRVVAARGTFDSLCGGAAHLPGPADGGSPLDANANGVVDLGGNVSEWVADAFQSYGVGCWSGTGLLVAPLCSEDTARFAARGGDYRSAPASARAAGRVLVENRPSPAIGVRCVASAR